MVRTPLCRSTNLNWCSSLTMIPTRPRFPKLMTPLDVPKRKMKSEYCGNPLLHAMAHIELNAADLYWGLVITFFSAL